MELNTKQREVFNRLTEFLNNDSKSFLLLGQAGTGKTLLITHVLNNFDLSVCFCAFTNKATNVLKNMENKKGIFLTIHKLLDLEPFNDSDHSVKFKYIRNKAINSFLLYDVIVFDECSTISKDLFNWINITDSYIKKNIKYIYLGDRWQLPPVNEMYSEVFNSISGRQKAKLVEIMRSRSQDMVELSNNLLNVINKFKENKIDKTFLNEFPDCVINKKYNKKYNKFVDDYVDTITNDKLNSSILLSYSKKSVEELNNFIQEKINAYYKNKEHNFHHFVNNRITIDRVCDIYNITSESGVYAYDDKYITTLYPGDIYLVTDTKNVRIRTSLHDKMYSLNLIEGQLLKIKPINNPENEYQIFNINYNDIYNMRTNLRNLYDNKVVVDIMNKYYDNNPLISRGYAITVYKSQGSEWSKVYVYLSSICYSFSGEKDTEKRIKMTFSACYTALTRARDEIICCY